MLGWIAAFSCEKSRVRIGTHTSTLQYINGGISQGSKLCPLLFAVLVNELLSVEHSSGMGSSGKCKDMIVDFLHFNTRVLESIVIGATQVETVL